MGCDSPVEEKGMAYRLLLHSAVAAVAASALLAGCAGYYRVTDPGSGRQYYTTKVEKSNAGAVSFKDNKGSQVTLQSSEVSEISKSEYEAATKQ
jgi:hypothetical protein